MGRKKMLIIDDNSMIRSLLEADFEDDFDVEVSESGTDGLTAAARLRPDVILLDINMPDLSGVEVIDQLEDRAETRNIPVIVITASEYNNETKRQLAPHKNFRGFLSKLAPTDEIRETVRLAIR